MQRDDRGPEVIGQAGERIHHRGHLRGPVLIRAVQSVQRVEDDQLGPALLDVIAETRDRCPVIEPDPLAMYDLEVRCAGPAEGVPLATEPPADAGHRAFLDDDRGAPREGVLRRPERLADLGRAREDGHADLRDWRALEDRRRLGRLGKEIVPGQGRDGGAGEWSRPGWSAVHQSGWFDRDGHAAFVRS